MKQIVLACVIVAAATPALAACPVKAPPGLVTQGTLTIGTMLTNPPQTFVEGKITYLNTSKEALPGRRSAET